MAEATMAPEKKEFQAEVKQLLDLMIHSIYSNKEIFLRELVSNASDAIDKARFDSLTNPDILGEDKNFQIRVRINSEEKQIVITDNGIGMTKEELIRNIGTIANSGTREYLNRMKQEQKGGDVSLIGQFGVGFYSVFMVADKVTLVTKRLGSEESAWRWESTGDGTYTLEEASTETRGTEIILHIKEDEKEFLEEYRVRSVIRKYSEYVTHPIIMLTNDTKDKEEKEERLNENAPLWRRAKAEITQEQYDEFYKHISYDQEAPLALSHNQVEGTLQYSSLLYVPAKAPYDLYQPEKSNGLSLYVKRIFIMNDCKELLPSYLRFVKGIVDSEDLPLNVSREILQKNAVVQKINRATTKKVINLLETMAKDKPEDYKKFWKEFGNVLKEGFHMNFENVDELKRLLRFESSQTTQGDYVSLEEYIGRMKDGQKEIYYITGESRLAVERSPHLEVFRKKDIEVLYLVDPIDEWVVQSVTEFGERKLASVTKGELDLGELSKEEKKVEKEAKSKYKDFMKDFEGAFSERLKEVRISSRLSESPCCLVADKNDMGANMERILKMAHQSVSESKRILEINPAHPIIENLNMMYEKNSKDERLKEWWDLLLDQSLLAEGSPIKDPAGFVSRMNKYLKDAVHA